MRLNLFDVIRHIATRSLTDKVRTISETVNRFEIIIRRCIFSLHGNETSRASWSKTMSRNVKIILSLVVSIVLLFVIAIGASVYWLSKHSGEYLEAGRRTIEEGERYGHGTDNVGCLREALARHKQNPSLTNALANNLFLRGCLEASRPTEGFCNDVPKPTEFVKAARWQIRQCQQAGLTDGYCGQLFSQVQSFCETKNIKPDRNQNSN